MVVVVGAAAEEVVARVAEKYSSSNSAIFLFGNLLNSSSIFC